MIIFDYTSKKRYYPAFSHEALQIFYNQAMQYKEIMAKSILNKVKGPDDWFGLTYNINLYRGCEHQCIYCDTRSECYNIADFQNEVLVKVNGVRLLKNALPRQKVIGTIGFGSMNDPYTVAETRYGLTGAALDVIAEHGFPAHIITKSDMVLKDLAALKKISTVMAQVSFSITTVDDDLAAKIEPGAPSPSRRLRAMRTLAEHGISTGIVMMPVLPFILDNQLNISTLVEAAHTHGAMYILPAFGVSLRDRQREYFYARLDESFPGVRAKYEAAFGNAYQAPINREGFIRSQFMALCQHFGIATSIPTFTPRPRVVQPGLFE